MYKVLYRKWRPSTFDEVQGQNAITSTLKNEIEQNRLNHAYLFVGSRGTGKTTCAKILAKAANCLNPINGNPCNQCEICKGIDDETILDITEIDAASNNGVNEIRELRQNISYMPSRTKYRVYIIDEVHMLTMQAFNALLKTLEEPPEHIIFILATTELHKLPATITSRCQRFDFRRISVADIASRLEYVSKEEGFEIDSAAANLIASLADGGLRDALSILEKVANAYSKIDENAVIESVGITSNENIFKLYEAIEDGDASSAIVTLNALYQGSRDFKRICEDFVLHYRNLMLIKTVKDARELIVCPESDYGRLIEYADKTSLKNIIYKINQLSELFLRISHSSSPRYEFEMAVVRLTNPPEVEVILPDSKPISKPAEKIKSVPKAEVKEEVKAEKAEEEKIEESPAENNSDKSADSEIKLWPKVLAFLNETDKMLYATIRDSKAYFSGDTVLISTENNLFPALIKQEHNRAKIKAAIEKGLGKSYSFKLFEKGNNPDSKDPLDDIANTLKGAGIEFSLD